MTAAALATPRLGAWPRAAAALALAVAGLLLIFARDAADMARIWWTSSTYEHCLLVVPIAGWLAWLRRPELARLEPFGWAPGLALVAAAALLWMVGEAGGAAILRHLALVVMGQGLVVACLGPAVARGLLFPLAYLLFLVPFGEAFEPPLQTLTAQICRVLLAMAGVPAQVDGVFIAVPAGLFQVAEACSGVKFLVAMIAFGALAAHVGFRSWTGRVLLMAAALVLPVLANGVRAWGTIMVAERMGAAFAGGFDHVFYGWIFFGLVIALMLGAAWRFFDRPIDGFWIDAGRIARATERARRRPPIAMVAAALSLAALAPLWTAHATRAGERPLPPPTLPRVPGWTLDPSTSDWRPRFDGADRLLQARYRDPTGARVDLAIALFAGQGRGRSLVGYGQGAAPPDSGWTWMGDSPAPPGARALRLRGAAGETRAAVLFFRLGGALTGDEDRVKLETLRLHLLGGPQAAAAVLVSADDGSGGRAAVDRFLRALGPVAPLADRLTGR